MGPSLTAEAKMQAVVVGWCIELLQVLLLLLLLLLLLMLMLMLLMLMLLLMLLLLQPASHHHTPGILPRGRRHDGQERNTQGSALLVRFIGQLFCQSLAGVLV
jgi:hypothetical protein